MIRQVFAESDYLLDPHTANGVKPLAIVVQQRIARLWFGDNPSGEISRAGYQGRFERTATARLAG